MHLKKAREEACINETGGAQAETGGREKVIFPDNAQQLIDRITGSVKRTYDRAGAGSGNHGWPDPVLLQGFDSSQMPDTAQAATGEYQPHLLGLPRNHVFPPETHAVRLRIFVVIVITCFQKTSRFVLWKTSVASFGPYFVESCSYPASPTLIKALLS